MDSTPKSQWEYIYQTIPVNQIPWETGKPSSDLLLLFRKKLIKRGMKVLDLGCGLGTQTRFMAKKGVFATGIDISETAIKRAREQVLKDTMSLGGIRNELGIGVNFIVGDVAKMPFPNGAFDFIYDRGCYHHLNLIQRKGYIKEVSRVLAPNGLLHMMVFAGTVVAPEVITHFFPSFESQGGYEDTVHDHTNDQEITVNLIRFKKIS